MAYCWPDEGLRTGLPVLASVGTQYGSSLVAKGLVPDVFPLRSTVFNPGMNPTRRGSPGPRLVAPPALAVYPVPAADGRGWKYWGKGFPILSRNSWPIRAEPMTLHLAAFLWVSLFPVFERGGSWWCRLHLRA